MIWVYLVALLPMAYILVSIPSHSYFYYELKVGRISEEEYVRIWVATIFWLVASIVPVIITYGLVML